MSLAQRLDPERLARLGSLPVQARMIVESALTGLHRASLHGSSVEFAEHKVYSPGDELRHVDWKAYAKLDRYYVKQFEQEAQLTLYLVLDASASMAFAGGGLAKLEYAALSLAALAYLVIQQHDAVGLVACGDRAIDLPPHSLGSAEHPGDPGKSLTRDGAGVCTMVPPRAGLPHLHDLLGVLEQLVAAGGKGDQSPAEALGRIAELARRRRSLIVVASDLFDPDDKTVTALCALRAQRHDVIALHVLDPHERTFPYDGLTEFRALESGEKRLVNPAAIRRDYIERMNAFCASCQRALTQAGADYHAVATDRPLEQTLLDVIVGRAALQRGRTRRIG